MPALYKWAAEGIVLLHFLWIVFVVTGAFFLWRTRRWKCVHLAAVLYSLAIEIWAWICPLTYLEQWLWVRAGIESYEGSFITHYLEKIIYLGAPQWLLVSAVALLLIVTVYLYFFRSYQDVTSGKQND